MDLIEHNFAQLSIDVIQSERAKAKVFISYSRKGNPTFARGVLQCAGPGRYATPTAPRPASARDSPWGQDTVVRLSFG
jgi:hypothetical protein